MTPVRAIRALLSLPLLAIVLLQPHPAVAAGGTSAFPAVTPAPPEDTRGADTAAAGPRFEEKLREHSFGESARYLGLLYAINLAGYIVTQREAIRTHGGWDTYGNNLFKVVRADYDVVGYNWGTHVATGTATNLFYRSRGYSRIDSLVLAAIQSALFEFTIEVYTEPASLEDLINTPILGAAGATLLEWTSFKCLNSDSKALHVVGHILNPFTLFGLHEGEARLEPRLGSNDQGVNLSWRF